MRDAAYEIARQSASFQPSPLARIWTGLVALVGAVERRSRYRRTLASLERLDDNLLRDIGLTRADLDAARDVRRDLDTRLGSLAQHRRESRWQL